MTRSVVPLRLVACVGVCVLGMVVPVPGAGAASAGAAGAAAPARAGAAAEAPQSFSREALRGPLATLQAERLSQRFTSFSFIGVSQGDAERLFAGAVAAAYAEAGGRLVLLASPGYASRERLATLLSERATSSADALPRAEFQQSLTLSDFAAEIDRELPGLRQGSFGRHILKMPIELDPPPGFDLKAGAASAPAKADATVFSESFESGISSSIWQLQSPHPDYAWGATTCAGPGTGKSADAVRGGTHSLNCADVYPIDQYNWMAHKNCENFFGATQAWLQMHVGIWTTNTKADSLSVVYPNFSQTRYIGFWHAGTWTPAWTFYYNLKQWEGIGDLTARECNQLIFVFMSDNVVSPPPPGYGARVDDILIFTGSNPPLTCSVSADTTWGAAPLTVHFTGSWSGGSGQTFAWDFNDDSPGSAEQNPSHPFSTGDYDPYFEVYLPTGQKCEASLHVTAHGGADDICTGATAIAANSSNVFSTEGYTRDQGITTDCTTGYYATGATRWFTYIATQPGYGVADLCGSIDNPYLTWFKGSCGTLQYLAPCYPTSTTCSGTAPSAVPMQPGEQFYFQVARTDDVGANTTLNFAFAPCTVACTANVPATGSIGSPVSFAATSTPTNCPLTADTYAWTFGDGGSSTQKEPQHTYTSAGAKSWTMTATINGVHCSKNGTITISALPAGDVNGDTTVNVGDVFYLINNLFAGGPGPVGSGDVNGDGQVNVSDVFYLINYLFAGGPAPV